MAMQFRACVPRSLTRAEAELAARRALELNPANAARSQFVERTPVGRRGGTRRIALLIANRWPVTGVKLTVRFLDGPKADLRKSHPAAHERVGKDRERAVRAHHGQRARAHRAPRPSGEHGGLLVVRRHGDPGDQRPGRPTLNLEGFTMKTSESEFKRVVRHEAGHTLGFEHEHMRTGIVKQHRSHQLAIRYFDLFRRMDRAGDHGPGAHAARGQIAHGAPPRAIRSRSCAIRCPARS